MNVFPRAFVRKRVISLAATASVAATSLALSHGPTRAHHIRGTIPVQYGTMPVQYVAGRSDYSDERPFQSENDVAVNKMMADMTVKPTGDVDRDFVAMMVPHHQGAIDMAKAFLRYGHNEQLRRMAQEIVVTQQQEIAAMRPVVERLPTSAASATQPAPDSMGMKMK
jgi:uncharacterized protein (DUF305 family)